MGRGISQFIDFIKNRTKSIASDRLFGALDRVFAPVSAAPLVTIRVVLGFLLFVSTLRFMALGWIEDHYLAPVFHFKYYGFGWVPVLPAWALYGVHLAMLVASLGVVFGACYRLSAWILFLCFTYTELIDLTYYLNHYYFVSVALLLLALTPAHRDFSVDARRQPAGSSKTVPRWAVLAFQVQIALVYFYAGIWKINYDWLINALPLKIWIPANDQLPFIGPLFRREATPYLFSWAGMLYDTSIVAWLLWRKTRLGAWMTVLVFHTLTGLMFQIGVFPLVMIGATLVFFSTEWHERWQSRVGAALILRDRAIQHPPKPGFRQPLNLPKSRSRGLIAPGIIACLLLFQLVFPWRYVLYPGNIFWTEEGYRFSWRVMLMEKAGTATFFVKDKRSGREGEVVNREFLNAHQEKQMAMQPDMILQFAHFLGKHYQKQGIIDPEVRVESYATLNGRPSRLLMDPSVDLMKLHDGWKPKTWIRQYEDKK